jgi:hypothetical protein
MAKPSEHASRAEHAPVVPAVPLPSSASAGDGVERARAKARRYLPDAVDFLAAVGFSAESEAALHTRVLAVKEIVSLAGAIPQPAPSPPLPPADERPGDGRDA